EEEGLERHGVDALHAANRGEPAGGAARAEADDERRLRPRMPERADQAEHDLRAGVAARRAVGLAVDYKRVAARLERDADAAFHAVAVPVQPLLHAVLPAAEIVDGVEHALGDAAAPMPLWRQTAVGPAAVMSTTAA